MAPAIPRPASSSAARVQRFHITAVRHADLPHRPSRVSDCDERRIRPRKLSAPRSAWLGATVRLGRSNAAKRGRSRAPSHRGKEDETHAIRNPF